MTTPKILIVNQHGDNRGDEAALYGMLQGIRALKPGSEFTVIHQFRNDASVRAMAPEVELITLKLPVVEAARLVLYLAFRVFGLRPKFLLGKIGRATIAAYESADVVVSAPGGPYFGDLYINHEFVHWLYVWMAALHKKPSVLYATSAGPFASRWANPFRRFTYRRFKSVIVREEISAQNIRGLFGSRKKNIDVQVTIDSALQVYIAPAPRASDRGLIVISAINWNYKGAPDINARRSQYDTAVATAAAQLAEGSPCDIVLVPQLHSTIHRDAPYLETLASLIRATVASDQVHVTVIDDSTDMLAQRAIFASADWVIAGRYHPAVFALSAGVPQLCIPYEHKATGLLEKAGLGDLVLPIEDVSVARISDMVNHLLRNRSNIAERSATASIHMRELSSRTSAAVVAALDARAQ